MRTNEVVGLTHTDEQNLHLLSIGHYVSAGITAFFGSIPLIHVALGVTMMVGPESMWGGEPPPPFMGALFAGLGITLVAMFWIWAGAQVVAARCIALRRHRTFVLGVSAFNLLNQPLGTMLGVLTGVLLLRDNVTEAFEQGTLRAAA
jgi:hypothetical protein